jgi:hypothetical protein
MQFQDISRFTNVSDYLPILNGALITDLIVIALAISGFIKSITMKEWYHKYGLAAVLGDVLILVIGVIIVRATYSLIFSKFSIVFFVGLAVIVQLIHDLSFAQMMNAIPRGRSMIMDTFKDYGKEMGGLILIADALMISGTSILGSLLASSSLNTNIIVLIVSIYMVPYFIYTI